MTQSDDRPRRSLIGTLALGSVAGAAVATTIANVMTLRAVPEALGLDLPAYIEASKRLLVTGSPYSEELHAGPLVHVASNIPVGYLYPPPVAQLFVPLSMIPFELLAVLWATVQAVLLGVLLLEVYRRYGGELNVRTSLLILLAATMFHPTQIAIYVGNLSAWIAILTAVILLSRPHSGALAAAVAAWSKVTPGALAVGSLIDPSTRRAAAVSIGALFLVSFALSPFAWIDWVAVLPSLVGMPAGPWFFNLAPSQVLSRLGLEAVAPLVAVGLPAAFLGLTILNAYQGRTLAWVAAAAGVYLTGTATSWHQYFVILVPIAVAAWPSASVRMKTVIALFFCWYGPIWFGLASAWHQVIGLVLWLTLVVWIAAAPGADGVRLSLPTRLWAANRFAFKR